MSVVALDLDGTLIENRWPKMGDWLPGAVKAVETLLGADHRVFIYTARVSPLNPDGSERDPGIVFEAFYNVRTLLDDAGLFEVDIFQGTGKPFWDVLVDDKVMHFPGGPRSWKFILPKVLTRVHDEDTFQSVMDAMGGICTKD